MVKILRYIIFLFLLAPNWSYANIWGRVSACVTDPCSCGCPDVHETWDGVSRSYKYYCNCPPYRKKEGRAGCLKKFSLPGESAVNYLSFCAEDPGGNTYFNPKVKVRMQACNVAACWTESLNLNYDGQCTQWASPYGIPLLRLCARIAVPGSSLSSGQSDPGYTSHKHLNREGAEKDDAKVQSLTYNVDDPDNIIPVVSSVFIDRPKLCVYKDPWALDNPLDLMDINPLYQPFHGGSGLSPIAQILIALFDMGMTINGSIISAVFKPMGVPESAVNILTIAFSANNVAAIESLKTFGQLNRVVSDSLGCIDIPMGPFPPPYCSPMKPVSTGLTIDPICATVTLDSGLCPPGDAQCIVQPDSTNPCVLPAVTNASNNAINNMVRIGFDNFIPLCLPNNVGITPSTCVSFFSPTSASAVHAQNDILPKCGSSPCINTTLPVPAGNTGFRVLYTVQHGSTAFPPNAYYTTGVPDCPTSQGLSTGPCQSVWGINAGQFRDIAVTFPAIENGSTTNTITLLNSGAISMVDLAGVSRSFRAAITRVQNPTDSNAITLGIDDQNPSNICVFETTHSPAVLQGCAQRATPPLPTVTEGEGDNFNPSLNVSLVVAANSTTGKVTVPAVTGHNITNAAIPKIISLAGFQYSAFVTDNSYKVAPFDPRCVASSLASTNGGCSPNSGSLLGMYYLPNNALVSNDPTSWTTPEPQYLSGLEYINTTDPGMNNAYRVANIIGGNAKICLSGMDNIGSCPQNPRNCVLAKLDSDGNVSTDPSQRVQPDTTSVTLTENQFYNYSVSNANAVAVSNAVTSQTQNNPDIVSCQYYLSTIGVLPTPYTNIQECTAACSSPSSVVEYFVSPNPSQVVTICNTAAVGDPPSYCFWPTVSATTCQVSKLMTLGYLPPVTSPPTTGYSPNSKASAIEANLLKTPGSSDTCQNFLGAINSNYPGINSCNSDQVTSCSIVVETISSTTPAKTVQVKQCPDNSYCYEQTSGSSPCTLGCSGALQQPTNLSCTKFLTSASSNYSGISSCSNPVCPNLSTLQVSYPTATTCVATAPSCSLVETVRSGELNVPVNSCSATYTITDSNSLILASDVEVNFYCYAKDDSSCTLNTTNVNRLSAGDVVLPNPTTSYAPLICPPSIVTTPPPSDSDLCIPDLSQPNIFNPSVCGLRNKTDVERGICATVPALPNCPALADENHIQWPAAPPGVIDTPITAIGCVGAGYSQALDPYGNPYPLERYCFANPDASTAALAPFWGPILNPNAACILTPSCPEIFPTLDNNYTSIRGSNSDGSTTSVLDGSPGGMANITCSQDGYAQPSPATVKCVRTGNTAAFATPVPQCIPQNCNAVNTPGEGDANATWVQGSPGQVGVQGTCLSGYAVLGVGTELVRDCVVSGDSSAFSVPYLAGDVNKTPVTCSLVQCPTINTPNTYRSSDSNGNASWAATAPSGSLRSALACKFGYQINPELPSRLCNSILNGRGQLIGASWSDSISNPCISKTCPAIARDSGSSNVHAKWYQSVPTATKNNLGIITNISGAGASGSGWVLGTCKDNVTNDNYFCYGGQSSRRPSQQPRRQCIIDSSGNVFWGDPFKPSGRSAVGCCNSCGITDSNKGSCSADAADRDDNNIPYTDDNR